MRKILSFRFNLSSFWFKVFTFYVAFKGNGMYKVWRYSRIRCYGLTCLLKVVGLYCCAQTSNFNLLLHDYLLSIKTDSTSIKKEQIQIQSIENDMPDSAIIRYVHTYKESLRIGFHKGSSNALRKLGELYYKKSAYDTARVYFEKSIRFSELTGDQEAAFSTLGYLGGIDYYQVQYENALNRFNQAIAVLGKFKVKAPASYYFNIYYDIALTWQKLGNDRRAKEVLAILNKIAQKAGDSMQLMHCNTMTAYTWFPDDAEKTILYYKRALAYRTAQTNDATMMHLYNSLANAYCKAGNRDSAHYYVQAAFKISDKYKQVLVYDRMYTWDNLARIYHQEGRYKDAARIWHALSQEVEEKKVTDMFMHIAVNIADNYRTMGQSQKAYDFLLRYQKTKDSINNFQKSQSTELWLQSYLAKKDKILLESQWQLHQQKNLIKTKNFWIGAAVLSALLVLLVILTIIRIYRHKQKLQLASMKRLKQEQEINQLKSQIMGEEQERNRIAIELHNGIASELWSIKLHVGCMQEEERTGNFEKERLTSIHTQLQEATNRVRATAHNLMPDLQLEEGLAPALATLCKSMKSQTGLHIDFQEYGAIVRINEALELSLYRMVQELIQNALKHALGATQLVVQLGCTDQLLNITVEDNGIGFDTDQLMSQSGFGLGNIKKRVSALQGHFELKSHPGVGTTVYLEFDLGYLMLQDKENNKREH